MLTPTITKITINININKNNQKLQLTKKILEILTNMKPIRTLATQTNHNLNTHRNTPIKYKITIHNENAIQTFLKNTF